MKYALLFLLATSLSFAQQPAPAKSPHAEPTLQKTLPTSQQLQLPLPGAPQRTNSLPGNAVLSPDGRWLALLNGGYGTRESDMDQSIAVLNTATGELQDFPDERFGQHARQTYFYGLAWSLDGTHLYASVSSISDPEGSGSETLGNGIAVYTFSDGQLAPERFLKIPLQPVPGMPGVKDVNKLTPHMPEGKLICYPAGLATFSGDGERLLVACNLSDSALVLDPATGEVRRTMNLSIYDRIPAAYPFQVAVEGHGRPWAWVSLWNGSRLGRLDLERGVVERIVPVHAPRDMKDTGSHPADVVISPDGRRLYAALANTDEVAIVDTTTAKPLAYVSVRLPGQQHGGSFPVAVAVSHDGRRLFVANASSNSVAVMNTATRRVVGFIPTEWYPVALAVRGDTLYIATAKGQGSGPNSQRDARDSSGHPFIASLLHGSIARISIRHFEQHRATYTQAVLRANLMPGHRAPIVFRRAACTIPATDHRRKSAAKPCHPIRHVIYVIKENRTYDQLFGDIKEANGDPALVLYGEEITPNQHALARQFGILDNFLDSGEVSGNGHVWSTAAITSDYTERTWQIGARSRERTYDYEGDVANAIPLIQGIPDINEPGTGYLWGNAARHGRTYRHYGEYVTSHWCNTVVSENLSPTMGTPLAEGGHCERTFVKPGEPLNGAPSPYPWPVPILGFNEATKAELRGHFDPSFPDFRLDYPDQLRADEFLREFADYVAARREGRDTLPELIVLRLPNDHTAGMHPGMPAPAAAVADNDLALGRIVEAVSHSPYWNDTAIIELEDDAQDGADHVDAHRSIALVISKYSPSSTAKPVVVSHPYTTVSAVATVEALLGLPAMNNNDARAPLMRELFTGAGTQLPFVADQRNRLNGLIYTMNRPDAAGARESSELDFSHADAADSKKLNAILWRDRKGNTPMPAPVHRGGAHRERDHDDD